MKKTLFLLASALLTLSAQAKVELPAIFGDNMVLQRNSEVAVWGKARPNSKVTISPSWTKTGTTVTAGSDGKWQTRVRTIEAGGPYEIVFSDGEKTTIGNVLLGEVWFCSGQSNMEMPVSGFPGQPVEGSAEVIMSANPSVPIRMFKVARNPRQNKASDVEGEWRKNEPKFVANASATAYFFALNLQAALGVPVGIINTQWGGSSIKTWMSEDVFKSAFPQEDLSVIENYKDKKLRAQHVPCLLYNGMVAGLEPFTFKGILWYQGENDRKIPTEYIRLQQEYVKMMRTNFQNPDASFYFVQIAPYKYNNPDAFASGYFCEAQEKTLDFIPGSGMATTLDIGNKYCIHPSGKRQVGQRLAWLALQNTYGVKGIEPSSPRFKSAEFKGGKAVIYFKEVGKKGLAPKFSPLEGFEAAGEDKVFHAAKAEIDKKTNSSVIVSCPEVSDIKAVRYCFRNYQTGNLTNNYGIPVGPFRTDNWDDLEK